MAIFNVTEKQQKSHFFLQFFLLKTSLQAQKSTFPANFSPSPSLSAKLFALICYLGRATASHLVRTDLATIFNITSALIATNFDSVHSFPLIFHIYTKSTATPTYHQNFALVVFFNGCNFQNMPRQVKKFIQSRVPRLLRFMAAIFPDHRATGQIHQLSTTPNSLH